MSFYVSNVCKQLPVSSKVSAKEAVKSGGVDIICVAQKKQSGCVIAALRHGG